MGKGGLYYLRKSRIPNGYKFNKAPSCGLTIPKYVKYTRQHQFISPQTHQYNAIDIANRPTYSPFTSFIFSKIINFSETAKCKLPFTKDREFASCNPSVSFTPYIRKNFHF